MTKKKEKRFREILALLSHSGKEDVNHLSELMHVSKVTIRKDLDELEAQSLVVREHGYARLLSSDDISGRLAYHYDEKRKIAEKAAALIKDNDTVMIESGSCCALLARLLAETGKNFTIITNSVFISEFIRSSNNVEVILLGGIYQKESQCLVGPMVAEAAGNYNVKYLFVGTDGWSERTGFTNKDILRAQAVRDMARAAEEIVILTESEKFSHPGIMPMNVKNQPKLVITDENIPEAVRQYLDTNGIRVI